MERNRVATSPGMGWRLKSESGGDLRRNTQIFGQHLFKNLLHEGFTQKQIEAVLNEHKEIKYTKTNNRSVLGSMNDLAYQLEYSIQINGGMKGTNILELNHELNRIIFRSINYKHPIEMLRIKLEDKNI